MSRELNDSFNEHYFLFELFDLRCGSARKRLEKTNYYHRIIEMCTPRNKSWPVSWFFREHIGITKLYDMARLNWNADSKIHNICPFPILILLTTKFFLLNEQYKSQTVVNSLFPFRTIEYPLLYLRMKTLYLLRLKNEYS